MANGSSTDPNAPGGDKAGNGMTNNPTAPDQTATKP
jgi:hypothetical protein